MKGGGEEGTPMTNHNCTMNVSLDQQWLIAKNGLLLLFFFVMFCHATMVTQYLETNLIHSPDWIKQQKLPIVH